MRAQMPEARQGRGTGQSLRETANIGRHGWVQESFEMIGAHFLNRCLWRPSIKCNPVYRYKHAASIAA